MTDPTGLDVTICYYPGTFGHVGIGVVGNWYGTMGFRSRDHEYKGTGKLSIDVYEEKECRTIETSCEEDQCIDDCIERRRKNPGNYHFTQRNCTDFARDCLRECGLPSGAPDTPVPGEWFRSLEIVR